MSFKINLLNLIVGQYTQKVKLFYKITSVQGSEFFFTTARNGFFFESLMYELQVCF